MTKKIRLEKMLKKVKELPLSGWHRCGIFNDGEETAGALSYEFENSTISLYYTSTRWQDIHYESADPGFGGFAYSYPTGGVNVDARLLWKEKDRKYKSTWIPIGGGRQKLVYSHGSRGKVLFDSSEEYCGRGSLKDTFRSIWSRIDRAKLRRRRRR